MGSISGFYYFIDGGWGGPVGGGAQGLGCQPVLRGASSWVNAGSAARGAEPRWPGAEGDSGKPGRRLGVWDEPLGMHVAVLAALPESGRSSQREREERRVQVLSGTQETGLSFIFYQKT